MFKLYKGNRRYGKKVFATYEDARSYARKLIRAGKVAQRIRGFSRGDYLFSNPALVDYGLSIRVVV